MLRKCLAVFFIFPAAQPLRAEEGLPHYYELETRAEARFAGDEMFTTAGWLPLPARAFPGSARVLAGDALRERGYLYLGTALAEEAGIYVEYVPGIEGPTMVPHFRGGTGRDVLILIDGVPVNDLATSWADLKLIPVEAVDKVEIFYGPASYRWGDRAVAGIISVTTLAGPREAARALVSASDGSADTERYRFNFGMTTRGVDVFASGNRIIYLDPNFRYRDMFGRREEALNSSNNVDGRLGYRWGEIGAAEVTYGHYGGYESTLEPWTWDEPAADPGLQKNWQDRLRFAGRRIIGNGEVQGQVYYVKNKSWTDGGEIGGNAQTNAREVAGSCSYSYDHLGGSLFTVAAEAARREDLRRPVTQGLIAARVLEEMMVPRRPIYMGLGAAVDSVSPSPATAVSPRLAVAVFPANWFKGYGVFAGGVRFPSVAEVGRREEVIRERGYETGVRFFSRGNAAGGVSYFYCHGGPVYLDAEDLWTAELKRWGLEADGEGALPLSFDWRVRYGFTDAKTETGVSSAFIPRHRAFGALGRVTKFFKGDLAIRTEARAEYVGARAKPVAGRDRAVELSPDLKVPYRAGLPAYWQFGAHFGLAIITFQGYCNIENINRSRDYVVRPGYSVPRRWRTFVGFNWTLYD